MSVLYHQHNALLTLHKAVYRQSANPAAVHHQWITPLQKPNKIRAKWMIMKYVGSSRILSLIKVIPIRFATQYNKQSSSPLCYKFPSMPWKPCFYSRLLRVFSLLLSIKRSEKVRQINEPQTSKSFLLIPIEY